MLKKTVSVLAVAALVGCASAGATSHPAKDYNVITSNEITAQNGVNAYEVISHLRPQYLKTRGRPTNQQAPSVANDYAAVFIDSQFYGDLNRPRNIPSINIIELHYLPANEAVTRYGMQYRNRVIDIRTR